MSKEDEVSRVDVHTYKSMVRILMLINNTRPNIFHDISLISRYMSAPLEIHLKETKIILRYVKGTLNFGINYLKNKDVKLVGYSDFD